MRKKLKFRSCCDVIGKRRQIKILVFSRRFLRKFVRITNELWRIVFVKYFSLLKWRFRGENVMFLLRDRNIWFGNAVMSIITGPEKKDPCFMNHVLDCTPWWFNIFKGPWWLGLNIFFVIMDPNQNLNPEKSGIHIKMFSYSPHC